MTGKGKGFWYARAQSLRSYPPQGVCYILTLSCMVNVQRGLALEAVVQRSTFCFP